MPEKEPIGVVGVGWVGLVTATCFAELGHEVHAVDINQAKVDALRAGEVTIHEPGLPELLERNRDRLHFTTDIAEVKDAARLLFCCVDTPPTYSGDADLSRVQAVVRELGDDDEVALVMKSTVPSGTGRAIKRDKPDLAYVSCPEFLKEGTAVEDFMHPDRVVVGADEGSEWAAEAVAAAYEPLGGELVMTDVASAEMIKLASNAFLATKISFINEIANVSEEVGADVAEVARGMGLDERIGPSFLRAGIGYGGSCFAGEETLLVKYRGTPRLISFEDLWELASEDCEVVVDEAIEPHGLEAWSWVPGEDEPEWMPVSVLTRRDHEGDMVEVRTKMGRRITVTADHPFIVGDGKDGEILTRVLAGELTEGDWLPLAQGPPVGFAPRVLSLAGVLQAGMVPAEQVIGRPEEREIQSLRGMPVQERRTALAHARGDRRFYDIVRAHALRLPEACAVGMDLQGATLATAKNGTRAPHLLETDERFWRVVGLYLAEGCVVRDRGSRGSERQRIMWSFHPAAEEHLVDEVVGYWRSQGVKSTVHSSATARNVRVSSRILAEWWTSELGLGRNAYAQRLPDLVWEQTLERKQALLSALWEGDGSWSLVGGGPSVALEFGTVSDKLADGVVRLLGDCGVVCSWRRGRTRRSTKETHWLRISGADQVEASIWLVSQHERQAVLDVIARQSKRIAPTGYRRFGERGPAWVRVTGTTSTRTGREVYSLEVPGSHTVVASGGLVVSNCFPKDVSALKQLAGNSGYHFQLLNSVIEVNELQKRRVIGKLEKHLGSLVGKRIALLGLAFKPDTDDMREASSLVLSARLQGEGASVAAYDPVAEDAARDLLPSVEFANSAEEALAGADAAILVTEWKEFGDLDWAALAGKMANPVLIDGRNYLDPKSLRSAGFTYEGIGRA